MKVTQFINKFLPVIIAAIVLVVAILFLGAVYIDASRDISAQITDVYAKAHLVQQDFSNADKLSNVTCSVSDEGNTYTFYGKRCSLTVSYAKDGTLLSEKFTDYRLGHNVPLTLVMLILSSILAGMSFWLFVLVVELIETCKISRKSNCDNIKNQGSVKL